MSALISAFAYFKPAFSQSAAAPLPLFALLLFNAPVVLFTLRALFALPALGERNHQLRAKGLQQQAHYHAPEAGALSAGSREGSA